MKKVVLDTNVLVSGIFWGGVPLKILHLWNKGKLDVLASAPILNEYLKSLERIAIKLDRLDLYQAWEQIIPIKIKLIEAKKAYRLCRDPDDNKFIDCAIAGKANYLISGDNDLLVLKKIMNLQIIKPKDFLNTQHR